jgi:hypothetical protein
MAIPKKRRRRKRRYKTGIHRSSKCAAPIEYRSGWEKEVCVFLDSEPSVKEYGYECLSIPYLSNPRTGKIRLYFPDFLITYADGTKKLVEVKRKDRLNNPKVLKKAKAAEIWAKANGATYEFWSDTMIQALKRINEARNPSPPQPKRKPRAPRKTPAARPRKPTKARSK